MQAARKYAVNTTWILIEKVSRIISGLLIGILVARYLGPAQFGMISYALNVVAIFMIASTLGLDGIVVRDLITRSNEQHKILGTAFWMRLVGSLFVVLSATYYSYIRDDAQNTFIVFLVSVSVIAQSFTVIDFYFQSQVKGKYTAMSQVITLLISSVAKVVMIIYRFPVEYFAGMVLFESLLVAINQVIFYKHNKQEILLWKFSKYEMFVLIKNSWPLIVSGLIMMVYQKMDQILIKRFLDLTALGNYAAAVRISEASYVIPVAISAAILPGIVNNRSNRELQKQRMIQVYSILIWIAICIIIGSQLFADVVIPFLYKEQYYMAAKLFKIHIWSTIPIFFSTAWGMWIIAENKQRMVIYLQVVSLVLCFYLNIKLIPMFGPEGAAYAVVSTYYVGLLAVLLFYKPKDSIYMFVQSFNPAYIAQVINYWKNDRSTDK